MSSNNQIQLNPAGQVALAGAASFATNGISHPLCTIQTCLQARSPIPGTTTYHRLRIPFLGISRQLDRPMRIPFIGLFRGFNAVYAVDTASFAMAYVTNDLLKKHLGPIGSIFAASAVSTPFIAIGEGAMQNRQASNLTYRDRELWRRSVRAAGMLTTMKRELIWNLGIFYFTPKMAEEFRRRRADLPPCASQLLSGIATGSLIGFMTTPVSVIKTMVQTSKENLSIRQAIKKITSPSEPLPDRVFVRSMTKLQKMYNQTKPQGNYLKMLRSAERIFAGATPRVCYLGVSMCVTNLVYQNLPNRMPDILKSKA